MVRATSACDLKQFFLVYIVLHLFIYLLSIFILCVARLFPKRNDLNKFIFISSLKKKQKEIEQYLNNQMYSVDRSWPLNMWFIQNIILSSSKVRVNAGILIAIFPYLIIVLNVLSVCVSKKRTGQFFCICKKKLIVINAKT